ncbi:uncharacterized protein MKK02DRAFT_40605 [Dioszegia hungarica]|uniref:NADH dehydrogenase [ubiquinone] 1 beta subcomplex subunit 4 n=1 Tax=Dioszegia hungarica TaxID=4972 RepID=A0AA38H291_9TREE|nr:uncharacterized protein MKK02DRAFT_40605 [Dioszegia hungarica]KAI9632301.1 hypothetical protein MKK02DRAFT_40605 [Dioszegia hungarica]
MAGGGHHQSVRLDPAIERWSAMRENVYQNFTFTRRASRTAIALGILVPGAIALVAMAYDEKFDMAGKRRGESLITGQSGAKPAAKE